MKSMKSINLLMKKQSLALPMIVLLGTKERTQTSEVLIAAHQYTTVSIIITIVHHVSKPDHYLGIVHAKQNNII